MRITVKDISVNQIADPSLYVQGGVLHYELNMHCAHEDVSIELNEDMSLPNFGFSVYCYDCKNEELQNDEVERIIDEQVNN